MESQKEKPRATSDKLLEFQKKVSAIHKDSVNPFFKSKYFDVNTVIDTIKPILSEVGLVVLQPIDCLTGRNILLTQIRDGENTLVESHMLLPEIEDIQKLGAAITYFRRYALVSLLLLQGEEDDDGNKAVAKPKAEAKPAKSGSPYVCDVHGDVVKHYPSGTKNGKAYKAFYSCPVKDDGQWCRAKLRDLDHNEVRKNPETGEMEVVQREIEFDIQQ